jgi:hypothetical protein
MSEPNLAGRRRCLRKMLELLRPYVADEIPIYVTSIYGVGRQDEVFSSKVMSAIMGPSDNYLGYFIGDSESLFLHGYLTIKADDGQRGLIDVLISHDRLIAIAARSKGQILEASELIPAILQKPAAIFEGLCQDVDEDNRGVGWRCYAGIPSHSYTIDGQKRPTWEDEVFLVFVNSDFVAYNWRWEKCDLDNPALPLRHASRFTKRLL